MKKLPRDPDILEEYDFSKGVRGKYAQRYAEGTNIVVIEPDVAKIFPDHDSVNQALKKALKNPLRSLDYIDFQKRLRKFFFIFRCVSNSCNRP